MRHYIENLILSAFGTLYISDISSYFMDNSELFSVSINILDGGVGINCLGALNFSSCDFYSPKKNSDVFLN